MCYVFALCVCFMFFFFHREKERRQGLRENKGKEIRGREGKVRREKREKVKEIGVY